MPFSRLQMYLRAFFPRIPLTHWIVIGVVSMALVVCILHRKRFSTYGTVVLGFAFFMGLFLLDALALKRIGSKPPMVSGLNLAEEYRRLFEGTEEERILMLFNAAVFFPFGVCLSEFFSEVGRGEFWRNVRLVAHVSLGLSLLIELLQLVFRVGVFEVTDVVLNTVGAGTGAMFVLGIRCVVGKKKGN